MEDNEVDDIAAADFEEVVEPRIVELETKMLGLMAQVEDLNIQMQNVIEILKEHTHYAPQNTNKVHFHGHDLYPADFTTKQW